MLALGSSQPGTDDHKTRESKIQLSHRFLSTRLAKGKRVSGPHIYFKVEPLEFHFSGKVTSILIILICVHFVFSLSGGFNRHVIICQICTTLSNIVATYCKVCVIMFLILNLRQVYVSFEYIQE